MFLCTLATKWAKITKVGGMFRDFSSKPYPMFRDFSQKSDLLERHTPVLPYTASTPPPPPPPASFLLVPTDSAASSSSSYTSPFLLFSFFRRCLLLPPPPPPAFTPRAHPSIPHPVGAHRQLSSQAHASSSFLSYLPSSQHSRRLRRPSDLLRFLLF